MSLRTTALAAVASLTVVALAVGAPLARQAEAQTAFGKATAIGIPACVVRVNGSKVARSSEELNQRDYPDVVHADIKALQQRIAALECALADPQAAPAEKR